MRYLTLAEAAQLLRMSRKTLYNNKRLLAKLGAFKINGRWRVPEERLNAFVREQQRSLT